MIVASLRVGWFAARLEDSASKRDLGIGDIRTTLQKSYSGGSLKSVITASTGSDLKPALEGVLRSTSWVLDVFGGSSELLLPRVRFSRILLIHEISVFHDGMMLI
jgi:pectate lyase